MSLVAYGNSSDSEDDTSDVEEDGEISKATTSTVIRPQSADENEWVKHTEMHDASSQSQEIYDWIGFYL